ncbi:ParB/RepB/Spo0J family partition protein [Streptomyces violascens]|uniref:ParB-like N-terminal domain-containing protein n=1 Tax=Streptomyces violascens TaxID=67381 RepID=A0ABQ3QRJ7_9ACTN|nr:ParB/RepB/Spo0J family partition protein [Streptomyces violascens]GGU48451.1 hypothetical protein GCM10010289_81230 [Streptomyces violascens]GHI39901.1 hypothetical protein Sviol_43090 [Streptomyces violascens]
MSYDSGVNSAEQVVRRRGDALRAAAGLEGAADFGAPVTVPIESLLPADSPRVGGDDAEHVKVLAAIDSALPPILVHRGTMRVIDGMHRLRAAQLKGSREVVVCFVDVDEDDAFLLSVQMNIAHGLPLSLAERSAAVERILRTHPHWSDRSIAAATGLSAQAVASVRMRGTDDLLQSNTRVGRDGRVRPLSTAEGRRRASEFIATRPDASLREIAATAGISVGTARDVRERTRKGQSPVLAPRKSLACKPPAEVSVGEVSQLLAMLQRDPALRYNNRGRALLEWLNSHMVPASDWSVHVETIPAHCAPVVAELAERYARAWRSLARKLDGQVTG